MQTTPSPSGSALATQARPGMTVQQALVAMTKKLDGVEKMAAASGSASGVSADPSKVAVQVNTSGTSLAGGASTVLISQGMAGANLEAGIALQQFKPDVVQEEESPSDTTAQPRTADDGTPFPAQLEYMFYSSAFRTIQNNRVTSKPTILPAIRGADFSGGGFGTITSPFAGEITGGDVLPVAAITPSFFTRSRFEASDGRTTGKFKPLPSDDPGKAPVPLQVPDVETFAGVRLLAKGEKPFEPFGTTGQGFQVTLSGGVSDGSLRYTGVSARMTALDPATMKKPTDELRSNGVADALLPPNLGVLSKMGSREDPESFDGDSVRLSMVTRGEVNEIMQQLLACSKAQYASLSPSKRTLVREPTMSDVAAYMNNVMTLGPVVLQAPVASVLKPEPVLSPSKRADVWLGSLTNMPSGKVTAEQYLRSLAALGPKISTTLTQTQTQGTIDAALFGAMKSLVIKPPTPFLSGDPFSVTKAVSGEQIVATPTAIARVFTEKVDLGTKPRDLQLEFVFGSAAPDLSDGPYYHITSTDFDARNVIIERALNSAAVPGKELADFTDIMATIHSNASVLVDLIKIKATQAFYSTAVMALQTLDLNVEQAVDSLAQDGVRFTTTTPDLSNVRTLSQNLSAAVATFLAAIGGSNSVSKSDMTPAANAATEALVTLFNDPIQTPVLLHTRATPPWALEGFTTASTTAVTLPSGALDLLTASATPPLGQYFADAPVAGYPDARQAVLDKAFFRSPAAPTAVSHSVNLAVLAQECNKYVMERIIAYGTNSGSSSVVMSLTQAGVSLFQDVRSLRVLAVEAGGTPASIPVANALVEIQSQTDGRVTVSLDDCAEFDSNASAGAAASLAAVFDTLQSSTPTITQSGTTVKVEVSPPTQPLSAGSLLFCSEDNDDGVPVFYDAINGKWMFVRDSGDTGDARFADGRLMYFPGASSNLAIQGFRYITDNGVGDNFVTNGGPSGPQYFTMDKEGRVSMDTDVVAAHSKNFQLNDAAFSTMVTYTQNGRRITAPVAQVPSSVLPNTEEHWYTRCPNLALRASPTQLADAPKLQLLGAPLDASGGSIKADIVYSFIILPYFLLASTRGAGGLRSVNNLRWAKPPTGTVDLDLQLTILDTTAVTNVGNTQTSARVLGAAATKVTLFLAGEAAPVILRQEGVMNTTALQSRNGQAENWNPSSPLGMNGFVSLLSLLAGTMSFSSLDAPAAANALQLVQQALPDALTGNSAQASSVQVSDVLSFEVVKSDDDSEYELVYKARLSEAVKAASASLAVTCINKYCATTSSGEVQVIASDGEQLTLPVQVSTGVGQEFGDCCGTGDVVTQTVKYRKDIFDCFKFSTTTEPAGAASRRGSGAAGASSLASRFSKSAAPDDQAVSMLLQ